MRSFSEWITLRACTNRDANAHHVHAGNVNQVGVRPTTDTSRPRYAGENATSLADFQHAQARHGRFAGER